MEHATLDLNKLPEDPLQSRAAILLHKIDFRVQQAISFLQKEYEQSELFETARRFAFYDLEEAPRADLTSLQRVAFFPWMEARHELSEALNHCLIGSYRSVFDDCRRALELSTVGVYFIQSHIQERDAIQWCRSNRDTPFFSQAVKALLVSPRFRALEDRVQWSQLLLTFYLNLCGVIHVRGQKQSSWEIQPSNVHYNDVAVPMFSASSIRKTTDAFIMTVRHIATLFAAENPILLVGLDLFSKFGLNPPIAGFFNEIQSYRLHKLLVPEVVEIFRSFENEDEEVLGMLDWFQSLPNLSDEEIERQAARTDSYVSKGGSHDED